jgi:cell division protein ZapE
LGKLYSRQLAERGFRSDPAQLAAVDKLDDLRCRLIAARKASSSPLRRLFGSLGRNSAQAPERGVYLWGGVGRGKTWLMDLFYQSLPFPERRRRHFHRFMHDVHAELKTLQNRESPLDLLAEQIARDTRVLCFDELFVTDIADAMILGTLFEGLFKRGVTLVATSNVRPSDLYKDGLQRQRFLSAIDLIESHVDVLAVDGGTDYRLRQLTQAGTYLLSSAPDTLQRLETLFAELSYGDLAEQEPTRRAPPQQKPPHRGKRAHPRSADHGSVDHESEPHSSAARESQRRGSAHPGSADDGSAHPGSRDHGSVAASTIEIEGRPIPVVRQGDGVVWFTYSALCSGPRSQDDYIEIAREFQSVIVSDIPVLDTLRENEARRFIALVDELYDRNVNLIISAAAPPTELYRGDRLSFQFERTLSRLIEMQSEEYLAREHRP